MAEPGETPTLPASWVFVTVFVTVWPPRTEYCWAEPRRTSPPVAAEAEPPAVATRVTARAAPAAATPAGRTQDGEERGERAGMGGLSD